MQPGEGFLHWSFECAEEYFVSFLMMCAVCCAHSLAESPKGINGVMLGPEVVGHKFEKHWDLQRIRISFFLYLLF
jgi:hypothetical protein